MSLVPVVLAALTQESAPFVARLSKRCAPRHPCCNLSKIRMLNSYLQVGTP